MLMGSMRRISAVIQYQVWAVPLRTLQ